MKPSVRRAPEGAFRYVRGIMDKPFKIYTELLDFLEKKKRLSIPDRARAEEILSKTGHEFPISAICYFIFQDNIGLRIVRYIYYFLRDLAYFKFCGISHPFLLQLVFFLNTFPLLNHMLLPIPDEKSTVFYKLFSRLLFCSEGIHHPFP